MVLRLAVGRGGGAGRRGLFPRETVRRRLLLFHPPGSCRCIGRTSRAAWIARRPPWSGRRSSSAPRALEAEGGVPHGGAENYAGRIELVAGLTLPVGRAERS